MLPVRPISSSLTWYDPNVLISYDLILERSICMVNYTITLDLLSFSLHGFMWQMFKQTNLDGRNMKRCHTSRSQCKSRPHHITVANRPKLTCRWASCCYTTGRIPFHGPGLDAGQGAILDVWAQTLKFCFITLERLMSKQWTLAVVLLKQPKQYSILKGRQTRTLTFYKMSLEQNVQYNTPCIPTELHRMHTHQ